MYQFLKRKFKIIIQDIYVLCMVLDKFFFFFPTYFAKLATKAKLHKYSINLDSVHVWDA